MQYEEIPSRVIPDMSYADKSLWIIESTIPNLKFESTKGIISGIEKEPGIWWVTLKPGVQLISISADGFLPLKEIRNNFVKRQVWAIKVTSKAIEQEGYGSVHIETNPPACYAVLNGLRLPDKTPLTLEDQLAGNHKIQFDGGFEWTPMDTSFTIIKDTTRWIRFNLEKRETIFESPNKLNKFNRISEIDSILSKHKSENLSALIVFISGGILIGRELYKYEHIMSKGSKAWSITGITFSAFGVIGSMSELSEDNALKKEKIKLESQVHIDYKQDFAICGTVVLTF